MSEEPEAFELEFEGVIWTKIASCADARDIVHLPPKLSCVILRQTPRRRVIYIPGRHALIVKQYIHQGILGSVKNFWRGAPALCEWRALSEAERRGLNVPRALALGRRHRGPMRQSFLVTEFIDGAVSLEKGLCESGPPQKRWRIIREAALAIRMMHDKGYFQRDLHLGNLLYREQEPDAQLFFLDLHRVDIDPLRPIFKRWRDLAALHGGCPDTSRSDRLRFLKFYLSGQPLLSVDQRQLMQRLDEMGHRHRRRLWRSRQKRCLADNREFFELRGGPWKGFARRESWTEVFELAIAKPEQLLSNAVIKKDSRTATVGRLVLMGRGVFAKRYNYQGLGYALKDVLRASRAKRVWFAGNSCVMRGLSVALPIAFMERRHFRLLRESYLVTRAVEGEPLSHMLVHCRDHFVRKRALIGELGRYVRRMHDRGVAHRDLKADNFVAREEEGGGYRFYIVDFDGFYLGSISWRRRIKNLVRLLGALRDCVTITRTDAARFLRSYLGRKNSQRFGKIYKEMAKRTRKALRPRTTA